MDRKEIDAVLKALGEWIIRVCNNKSASSTEITALPKVAQVYVDVAEIYIP